MMKIIILLIYTFSAGAFAGNYNIDVLPYEAEKIPNDLSIDFSHRQSRVQPESKMPLFTQTCDNIAYSGVIEQQVISLLTDVKTFVTAITDPVVTVNKFDAGIFLYAFGKCFSKSTKEALGSCKAQKTGESCFTENTTGGVSNTDGQAKIVVGGEGSVESQGITTKLEISVEKIYTGASNIITTMIDNGWFDVTFECIGKEREAALKFLDGIFKRNYKIKTSIISSINKKCAVSIREDGDPSTWREVYELNKELMGGETSDVMKKIEDYVAKEITEIPDVDLSSSKVSKEINKINCYDGVGSEGCQSVSQVKSKQRLSKYSVDSGNNKHYQGEKAKEITSHFFDSSGNVIDKYSNKVGSAVNPIKSVLEDLVPRQGNPIDPSIFDEIRVKEFEVEFNNLKDRLGIRSGTTVSNEINNIFYKITSPKYTISIKRENGQGFNLPDGTQVDEFHLPKPISSPLVDPFNSDFIHYLGYGNKDNKNVIAKTYGGKHIVLNTNLSDVEEKSILGFYRALVMSLIVVNSKDAEELSSGISMYANEKLVSDKDYVIIKDSIDKAIDVHSKFNYKHILNDGYELSIRSGSNRASLEYYMIKFLLMKRILVSLFTIDLDPSIVEDNIQVSKIEINHELPEDIFYGLISIEKDHSLPRRILKEDMYYLVSRFYKILSSRYTSGDIIERIEIKSDQIEEYDKFNNLEMGINTLLNLIRATRKNHSIENLEVIENIR